MKFSKLTSPAYKGQSLSARLPDNYPYISTPAQAQNYTKIRPRWQRKTYMYFDKKYPLLTEIKEFFIWPIRALISLSHARKAFEIEITGYSNFYGIFKSTVNQFFPDHD